jgi:hypothetical protein
MPGEELLESSAQQVSLSGYEQKVLSLHTI